MRVHGKPPAQHNPGQGLRATRTNDGHRGLLLIRSVSLVREMSITKIDVRWNQQDFSHVLLIVCFRRSNTFDSHWFIPLYDFTCLHLEMWVYFLILCFQAHFISSNESRDTTLIIFQAFSFVPWGSELYAWPCWFYQQSATTSQVVSITS